MALTIVETRAITGGVDTHVAAALYPVGGLLGVQEFPVTPAGYARLLGWLGGFGTVCLVGIEGTGSYGAGLARHVTAAGVRVVEVDRSDRQDRRRQGKSDPLDAVSAARAAQSGRARGAPKGRDGQVEAIRALMVAKRSAIGERTQTINQARALVLTGPDDLRARFGRHAVAALVAELGSLRPRPGDVVGYATRIALRELGRRAEFLDGQLGRLDELIVPLVTARAPGLLALYGVGPNTAALLLIAAGDHPGRLRSEAAWAHLCGAAPIPASSGKTVRHRLNPGGDRQASHALWRIVFTRLGSHPATRAYAERRTAEGKSKAEIIRCLKRYVAREVYPHLAQRADAQTRGRPGPRFGCRAPAGLRTIRRPSPDPHRPAGRDLIRACALPFRAARPCPVGPPRAFRTAELELFHAARCRFRYSSWTSCGVL
jgi:transposase